MISCSDITYKIGDATLLAQVNWQAQTQKMNGILGANGAGKSTFLKSLLGLAAPQQGQVAIQNRPLAKWRATELAPIRAYMAQSHSIQLSLPVYEYLSLARLHFAESQQATDYAVEDVINRLNLQSIARKNIDRLSGGEWQRVDLARAWCQLLKDCDFQGTLLLLDEPGSALDIHQTQKLYDNLRHFTLAGGTVVIIEHDINLAARFCDQLTLLKSGQVIASGAVESVFTEQNINTCFDVRGNVLTNERSGALSFML